MQAGALDRRVTIERATVTQDSAGQQIRTWGVLATVWASVRPLRGAEAMMAMQVHATQTLEVSIRYREGIDPTTHRLLIAGVAHDITAAFEIGRREGLRMLVTKGANDG